MAQKVKFLWISDIHYKGANEYDDGNDKLAFDLIKSQINSSLNDYDGVLYILISGDISFSGQEKQYSDFNIKIIDCVDSVYREKVRVLVCPGNHDVSWAKFDQMFTKTSLKNKFNAVKEIFKSKNDKKSNLKFNKDKFLNIFENFSREYSQEKREHSKYQDSSLKDNNIKNDIFIFNKEEGIEISHEYLNTALEGYIIDSKNKIIFIVLNTSWYSIGQSLNLFIDEIGLKKLDKPQIIELIEVSQEYGHSFTGICHEESFKMVENIIKVFDENDDFTKICMMHHPIEWLGWEEKDSYGYDGTERKKTKLVQILERCNFILSGHVHPSRSSRNEKLFNSKVVHLRGPLFLSHHTESRESLFPCNGFVSIDLNRSVNDTGLVERSLDIEYHNIEYATAEPFVFLNSKEDKLPIPLKDYNIITKTSLPTLSNKEKALPKNIYKDINDKCFNHIKVIKKYTKKFFDEDSIREVNIPNDKIICYQHVDNIFIYQKDNYWMTPSDLFLLFIEPFEISIVRLFKDGYNICLDLGKNLEIEKETSSLTRELTYHNDERFNKLRIDFFNDLDLFINLKKTNKKFICPPDLIYLEGKHDVKTIFQKAANVYFSNHILQSDNFN